MANSKRQRSASKGVETPSRKRSLGKRDGRRNLDWRRALGLHDDFPLFQHQNGRWCKKVKGTLHYFGAIADDPKGEAALREWTEQKEHIILTGRKRSGTPTGLTIRDLCNKFLNSKLSDLDLGKLASRTFIEYRRTTDLLVDAFGASRLVSDLRPEDFEKLYDRLAKKHGIATLGREVTMARSVFKYAADSDLIDKAVKFGPKFRAPSKADKRKARAKAKHQRGSRVFEAEEIRTLLDNALPQLRAMILLGINSGLGNSDCATLPLSALDLAGGWLDFPRPKTGIDRRVPLWPETVEALKAVIAKRPEAKHEADDGLVFLTRLGQPWVRYDIDRAPTEDGKTMFTGKSDDAIAKATAKLLRELGIYRRGVTSFYTLRHTFETIAGGSKDQVAVDSIMGHVDPSMAENYRHGIEDARLRAVVDHVRAWLWPKPTKGGGDASKPRKAETIKAKPKPAGKAKRQTVKAEATAAAAPAADEYFSFSYVA